MVPFDGTSCFDWLELEKSAAGWPAKNSIRHNYIAIRYKCN